MFSFIITRNFVLAFFLLLSVSASKCGKKGEVEEWCLPESFTAEESNSLSQVPLNFSTLLRTKGEFIGPQLVNRSCSIVGHSESLLSCSFGSEIDTAEDVYRIGFVPLDQFAQHAGLKVTHTLCRSVSCQLRLPQNRIRDSRGFPRGSEYWKARIIVLQSKYRREKSRGKKSALKYLVWHKSEFAGDIRSIATNSAKSTEFRVDPTTGFHLSIDLLSTGSCKDINMYGFGEGLKRYSYLVTPDEGATRKQRLAIRKNIKRNHNTEIEGIIIRRLRATGINIRLRRCPPDIQDEVNRGTLSI